MGKYWILRGYYLIAASSTLPLCTLVEISDHKFNGQGLTPGEPFLAVVADRGGAVQGESERVDPGSTPKSLLPNMKRAEAARGGGEGADDDAPTDEGRDSAEDDASKADGTHAALDGGARDDGAPAYAEEQVPGFVWVVGATAAVVVASGAGAVLHTKNRTRKGAGARSGSPPGDRPAG